MVKTEEMKKLVNRYQNDPYFHQLVSNLSQLMFEDRFTKDDIISACKVAVLRNSEFKAYIAEGKPRSF